MDPKIRNQTGRRIIHFDWILLGNGPINALILVRFIGCPLLA